jgi:uncharacterized Fe-S cluster-containing radical SAM superfamily protein
VKLCTTVIKIDRVNMTGKVREHKAARPVRFYGKLAARDIRSCTLEWAASNLCDIYVP